MNKAINMAQYVQSLKPTEVIRDEAVKDRFISVYNDVWREGGEAAYGRESIYFNQIMRDKEDLRKTTPLSVFYAFIDLAVKGLSLAPGHQALCYLMSRWVTVGKDAEGKDIKEKLCCLSISGYGELFLRKNSGQIKYADNPVIVYEGDTFQYGEKDGQKFVNYMASYPRKSNKIIACYLKIVRIDGSVDYSVMLENDWLRLQHYSEKNNSYYYNGRYVEGKANALYNKNGQIDTGFLCAKCVKHAFKTYGKIKIGRGTVMQSDEEYDKENDYYGTEQPKAFGPEEHPAERGVSYCGDDPVATAADAPVTDKGKDANTAPVEDDGAF